MTSDVIAWATLGGILLTAIGTPALAVSTRRLAKSARDQTKAANRQLEAMQGQLQVAKKQATYIAHVGDLAVGIKGLAIRIVVTGAYMSLREAWRKRR
jgi:hypothetical protein